mgnify:CR=1 FL=1
MSTWDDWIGRQTVVNSQLDPAQSGRLQSTLDRESTLVEGNYLPPAWHWIYFFDSFRSSDLGHDGHTRLGLTLPQFPLPRRMWAGGHIKWLEPVVLGVPASRTTTIASIEEKTGRTGELIFVTLEHVVTQNSTACIVEEQNIVYREASKSSNSVTPDPAETESDFSQEWKFTSAELFRYSALTFNSHKIHYDRDYAREVEGYSNLVIHGPLLATLMLDLASQNQRQLREFSYRARSPICLPEGLVTHGRVHESKTELWVASESGALAMQGTLNS